MLLIAAPAIAQSDPPPDRAAQHDSATLAAAGETDLWLVRVSGQRFTLEHKGPKTKEGAIYRISEAPGRPIAAAADNDHLYLVFSDHSVRRFTFRPADGARPERVESAALPRLPTGFKLIDWNAGPTGPIALLRRPPEKPTAPSEEKTSLIDPTDDAPEPPENSADPAAQAESSQGDEASDGIRLLRLSRGRWERIDPPADTPADRMRRVVVPASESAKLILLSEGGDGDPSGLGVHHLREDGWVSERYDMPLKPDGRAVAVQRNLFLVQPVGGEGAGDTADKTEEGGPGLGAWWLRRGESRRVGPAVAAPVGAASWWAFARNDAVLLLKRDAEGELNWTRFDVTSEAPTVGEWATLEVIEPPVSVPDPALVAIAIALVVGVFFLFITAQRDPKAGIPQLPKEVRAAGVNRAMAAGLDLLPAVLLSMIVFQITDPIELLRRWPLGSTAGWDETLPGLLVIGAHALHTFLGEAFVGSTLGKALFSCRVKNLNGERPAVWQVLVRNVFKLIEMTVPLLLILPLLRIPYHQRLGDLIAGTVVVVKAPPTPSSDAETPEE